MTFSDKYQDKLAEYRLSEALKKLRKAERTKEARERKLQAKHERSKLSFAECRKQLMKIQGYRCAICRRHRSECGRDGLRGDCFAREIVRGLLCGRCKRTLRDHNYETLVIALDESLTYKIRRNAINYLENWPSQKLEYFLYRQSPYPKAA